MEMFQHCFPDVDSVGLARGGAVDFHRSRLFTGIRSWGRPLSSRGAGLLLISSLYTDYKCWGKKEGKEGGREAGRKKGRRERVEDGGKSGYLGGDRS